MQSTESIKALASALTKAQAQIEKAEKDKTNPHFRSKYADLGNVVDAIKPAIEQFGLSFIQVCHDCENAAKVETVILHESGEWLSCGAVSVPVSKQDAQGYGSALTYARRYSLSAAFGVAPEDDDGNKAAKNPPKKAEKINEEDYLKLSEAELSLRACGSIAALQEAWLRLNQEQRRALADVKEECKQDILDADAATEKRVVA